MGITTIKAKVANPNKPRRQKEIKFMVDSGAVYSVVDQTILKELSVKPHGEKEFILATGESVSRKIGGLLYTYQDEKGYAPVIFGEKGDSNLMGAVTLEALGLVLDPLKRRLLQLPMVLGGINKKP